MRVSHRLASGLWIRQDYRDAVRFVMFDTGQPEWPYATHGGTAFVINVDGRCFALLCKHTLGDFHWPQLVITDEKFGTKSAGLKAFGYPSRPVAGAIDGDILDLGLLEFSEDVDATFFRNSAYILDANTVCSSQPNDKLEVHGTLKDLSVISETAITPVFGRFEFRDDGPEKADPVLRNARSTIANSEVARLTGLSGAPVFNLTQRKLCGVVVRGQLSETSATIKYVEASDMLQFAVGAARRATSTYYEKVVAYPNG
jgi:hypothetical protein